MKPIEDQVKDGEVLSTGQLCDELGFKLTADQITGFIHEGPIGRIKAAMYWSRPQAKALCEKLHHHMADRINKFS